MQTYTYPEQQTHEWVAGLPEMFHQYLLGLAEAALSAMEGEQHFLLTPVSTSGWGVQDVLHITDAHPKGTQYRLFGFEPVDMALDVLPLADGPLLIPAQAAASRLA